MKTEQQWLAERRAKDSRKQKYPKLRGRKYTVIFERDKGKCQITDFPDVCLGQVEYLEGTLDHIWPASHGGLATPSNLQLACQPCNLAKSNTHACDCGLPVGAPGCRLGVEVGWRKYADYLETRMWYREWKEHGGPKVMERW